MPNKTLKIVLSCLALLVILAATAMLLYLTFDKPGAKTRFFARDINDATYDCEDKITSRFDDNLVSKHFDDLSSRYESKKHQYAIYYRISVKEHEDSYTVVNDYLVKCIVWEKLGYVSDFQVLDI